MSSLQSTPVTIPRTGYFRLLEGGKREVVQVGVDYVKLAPLLLQHPYEELLGGEAVDPLGTVEPLGLFGDGDELRGGAGVRAREKRHLVPSPDELLC